MRGQSYERSVFHVRGDDLNCHKLLTKYVLRTIVVNQFQRLDRERLGYSAMLAFGRERSLITTFDRMSNK